jgi:arsenite-transporting ATPase
MASFRDQRLLLFAGKGGTGKTTCAAAAAIVLARADSTRRVLLLSVDPAHSLLDVLDAKPRAESASVDAGLPNLEVRELNASEEMASRKAEIRTALEEIAQTFGAGEVAVSGKEGIGQLLELAPPGIDELLGLVSVMHLLESGAYSQVIVDTAPTGHALRLLEMPEAARRWVQTLLRILLKYRQLVRPGRLAVELLALSKSLGAFQQNLRQSSVTSFFVVTRPAEVTRLETERLLRRLKQLGVHVPVTVVNAVTPLSARCSRCRAASVVETRQIARLQRQLRREFQDCAIIQPPLVAPPPRGVEALERWARIWMS